MTITTRTNTMKCTRSGWIKVTEKMGPKECRDPMLEKVEG